MPPCFDDQYRIILPPRPENPSPIAAAIFSILPPNVYLSNLFQIQTGMWRASLYTPDQNGSLNFEFGDGKDPETALQLAVLKMQAGGSYQAKTDPKATRELDNPDAQLKAKAVKAIKSINSNLTLDDLGL